jgi:divinyl chlorophyllide a 8-vinyl-reductase
VARELLASGYRLICPVRDLSAPAAQALLDLANSREPGAPDDHTPASVAGDPRPAPTPADPLTLVEVDLADQDATAKALRDLSASAVVSCLASRSGSPADSERVEYGANHHLLTWATGCGATHFTLLSAICVQKPRLAFQHQKLRFERELADSGLGYAIVRPTAFFKSLSGQLARVKAGKPFLVFGQGKLTRCKPIAEADLARYVRLTLEDPTLRGVLPIGGPGPALNPADQAKLLEELMGRRVRIRSVTPALLSTAARVLDVLGALSPRLRDKAEFARIGHYYATESMLVWDADNQLYREDLTPEFGSVTLRDSYAAQLAGEEVQELGEHAMFE